MDREEMIRMLSAMSDYFRVKDDSPIAAIDVLMVITELKQLWNFVDHVEVNDDGTITYSAENI